MSDDDLKKHLITADYKGIEFKSLVLEEIISRVKANMGSED